MKKLIKTLLKIILGLVVLTLVVFGIFYTIYNQSLPKGSQPQKADALAEKMLKAINYDTYKATRFLEWSFARGAHSYAWDKQNGKVQVKWSDYQVDLNLNKPSQSKVLSNGNHVIGMEKSKLITKATAYFNNDSFWLVAPFKVFDVGTERSLVKLEDGSDGLLVTYSSGGDTPGDSYLWKLKDNGFPESYQMWVDIIPIGGLEATWNNWKLMESGIFLPTTHKIGPMNLNMEPVKAYN